MQEIIEYGQNGAEPAHSASQNLGCGAIESLDPSQNRKSVSENKIGLSQHAAHLDPSGVVPLQVCIFPDAGYQ